MPKAVVTVGAETQRFELKSLPEGWVELKRLTFGQFLYRRSLSSNLKLSGDRKSDIAGIMELANKKVTTYEFQHCIVDHNLEDEDGRKSNFRNESDVDRLDPRVGEEINLHIDGMNQFNADEDGDLGNSGNGSGPALS